MGSLWVYGGGHGFGWRLVKVWVGFNLCMGQICWVCDCCRASVGVSVVVRMFNGGGWLVGSVVGGDELVFVVECG